MKLSASSSRQILAGGHLTNYFDIGEKAETIVLLHGSGPGVSAWGNWAGVLPDLAQDFRVIAPDIAGFGETEFQENLKYDIKLWVAHLVDILNVLQIEKATFVGNSFGGALSLGLALFAPEKVNNLILMGTPAGEFEQTPGLRSAWEYEPSLENMEAILRLFPYDQTIINEEMIQARYKASARPGAQEALRQLLPKPQEGVTIVKGFPEASIKKIKARTLVLHGREDAVVPPACGLLLANSIPNADLYLFGQCGHWVQIEKKNRFLQLIRDFCRESSSGEITA